jgi:hypothetical protein
MHTYAHTHDDAGALEPEQSLWQGHVLGPLRPNRYPTCRSGQGWALAHHNVPSPRWKQHPNRAQVIRAPERHVRLGRRWEWRLDQRHLRRQPGIFFSLCPMSSSHIPLCADLG